jgi:hypothetical protein
VDRVGRERRVQSGDEWDLLGGPAAREACRTEKWPGAAIRLAEKDAGAGGASAGDADAEATVAQTAPALADDPEMLRMAEALLVA